MDHLDSAGDRGHAAGVRDQEDEGVTSKDGRYPDGEDQTGAEKLNGTLHPDQEGAEMPTAVLPDYARLGAKVASVERFMEEVLPGLKWLDGEPVPPSHRLMDLGLTDDIFAANYGLIDEEAYTDQIGIDSDAKHQDGPDAIAVRLIEDGKEDFARKMDARASLHMARHAWIERFGFAIPCAEALDLIASHTPLVEVGAGTGFWAALLACRGADVIATDVGRGVSYAGDDDRWIGRFHPVEFMEASHAVRSNPGRNLLSIWPSYNENWIAKAATHLHPGRRFILIGEGEGGCTGDDALFELLDRNFEMETHIRIPVFPGMHDRLSVYLKK